VTLSLTPKHLQGLGLIQKSVDDTAHDINFLFSMAMDKVSSLNSLNILVSHSPLINRWFFCLTLWHLRIGAMMSLPKKSAKSSLIVTGGI
jgi:Angiotensin-converting enzyme